MFANTRILALISGCIVALLILTGCQPGHSSTQTTEPAVNTPEVIEETVVVVETVKVIQPTTKQQNFKYTPVEQEQPIAKRAIVEPKVCPPTATQPIAESTINSPIAAPSIDESSTNSQMEESVPRILIIDMMADWDGLTYTRLTEIAALKGVQVDIFDEQNFDIVDSYDRIIVFGGGGGGEGYNKALFGGINTNRLMDLMGPIKRGGRLVFFVLPRVAYFNDSLSWFFATKVASEYITPPGQDIISIPGGVLSEMWSGLEIGSRTDYDEISLQTYFEPPSPLIHSTSMSNQECEERKISISGGWDSGEFLFISNFATGDEYIQYRNAGNFLHDGNIDGWDNQEAAEILIDWLVRNE